MDKKIIIYSVLLWVMMFAGSYFADEVHAVADLDNIRQQVRQTAQEHQEERGLEDFQDEPEPEQSSFWSTPTPKPIVQKPVPPDKVTYNWLSGKIKIRRVNGNWYLSIW